MAKFAFTGCDEYINLLEKVKDSSRGQIKMSVYDGAAVVADAVKSNLAAVSCGSEKNAFVAYGKRQPATITAQQKEALISSMGLSKMVVQNGYIYTKLGFDGYNDVKTRHFPNGQPNVLIARALESGSTAMKKQPFVRPALKACENRAVQAMASAFDSEIEKITGG